MGLINITTDLNDRYARGEFEVSDSIHFSDSLKFTTPGGIIVYGGGGIMPDKFVPADTSGISGYFSKSGIQLSFTGLHLSILKPTGKF